MLKRRQFLPIYWLTVLLFLMFTLTPLVWALTISLTPTSELMGHQDQLLPQHWTLHNYQRLFSAQDSAHKTVFQGLKNSLITAGFTLLIGLPMAVLTSYGMVRFRFWGRQLFLKGLLITIVIPVFTTIIPIFAIYSNYRLLDNLFWVAVIYVTAFLPLVTWMLINYFQNIPKEMWEAGQLDGCNEWDLFWRIILPLSKTALVTSVLILLLMSWSQFQIPMILTASQQNKVVTLVLSEFMTRDAIDYGMIAAAGLITILPPAVLAMLFRKMLISGFTAGAVKG